MGTTAKSQIVQMLKADHKKVKKAFRDFEKIDPKEDAEGAEALVAQTLADIEVHATLEEQVFYPTARSAIQEEDLVDEAEVEHMTVKVLIEQLKNMSAGDEKYAATFKVLGEYIAHHVKEEEGEMFKQLTNPGVDWNSILEEMQTQRAQLLEEKGLPAESDGTVPAKAGRSPSRGATSSNSSGEGESRPRASSGATKPAASKKS